MIDESKDDPGMLNVFMAELEQRSADHEVAMLQLRIRRFLKLSTRPVSPEQEEPHCVREDAAGRFNMSQEILAGMQGAKAGAGRGELLQELWLIRARSFAHYREIAASSLVAFDEAALALAQAENRPTISIDDSTEWARRYVTDLQSVVTTIRGLEGSIVSRVDTAFPAVYAQAFQRLINLQRALRAGTFAPDFQPVLTALDGLNVSIANALLTLKVTDLDGHDALPVDPSLPPSEQSSNDWQALVAAVAATIEEWESCEFLQFWRDINDLARESNDAPTSLSAASFADLQGLTGPEFENRVRMLLESLGLRVEVTKGSWDGGIDCVAYDERPIAGGKIIVQAKRYTGTVDASAVRDLFGTMHSERAAKGVLITTGKFGPTSWQFAEGKPIELIDGNRLMQLYQQLSATNV
jgi:hypothetical protein